ncbi:MAG: YbjN domain-containing protein [Paracoccus sp. (in: a-proteobacteria)]|nr:YbjN domain-containing protein [Paracoccus sp. (in: a-proteobacteria)]
MAVPLALPVMAQNTTFAEDNKTQGEQAVDKPATSPSEWADLPAQELADVAFKREQEIAAGADDSEYVDYLAAGRVDKPAVSPSDWAGLPQQELVDAQIKADQEEVSVVAGRGSSTGMGAGFDKGAGDMADWPEGNGLIFASDPAAKQEDELEDLPRVDKPAVSPSDWAGLPAEELVAASQKTAEEVAAGAYAHDSGAGSAPWPPETPGYPSQAEALIFGSRDQVANALGAYGLSNATVSPEGERPVTARLEGVDFTISFAGCEDADRCTNIVFAARFDAESVDLGRLNNWNAERRSGRAYLDPEGRVVIDRDISIAGGMNAATFNQNIDEWARTLRSFAAIIGD